MSTTTCPGNFILIPPTPDHHHHHPDQPWTTQSLPGSSWSTKSTTRIPTLFQVHSNLSGQLHAYRSHSRPLLPSLQNYPGPVKASLITPDNHDLLHDHQHCSKLTTTFPGHSKLIPATLDHQRHHPSLQNYHGPVLPSQTNPDRLGSL